MTWRKIDGYQYPYRINEEAQVQKWDGKQWIDIRARISGNRAVVYLRTVEGKQYKAALVRLMDDAFWEGRAKRDGLHITHRNGVKLDCELRNLVAVKPGQAGRKYHVQFVDFRTQKMQTRTSRSKLTQESLALRSLPSA